MIHFLLFLGRALGLGFHMVICRMDWEPANLGFFIYQTKQTQTSDLMAGIPKWMISLSTFNNGMRPWPPAGCLLVRGERGVVDWNGEITSVKRQKRELL